MLEQKCRTNAKFHSELSYVSTEAKPLQRFAFSTDTITEEIQLQLVSQAGFRKREEGQVYQRVRQSECPVTYSRLDQA